MTDRATSLPDLEPVDNYNAKQAAAIIDEETTWVELATELYVSTYKADDAHEAWHPGSSFRPMFLAYLWASVEGYSLTTIPERLREQPELARAFGFKPESIPSKSTFKPCRLEEDRFAALQNTVSLATGRIQAIAANRGAPICPEHRSQRLIPVFNRQVSCTLSGVFATTKLRFPLV